MRPNLQSLVLCLFIGAASCADGFSPAQPVSSAPLREGVTGQIKDNDGSAVAGATVLASSLEPDGPAIPEIAIVSDESGRYEWPLRPGRYQLTAVAEGY